MHRTDKSSRGDLPSVECLRVIEERHRGGQDPTRAVEPRKKECNVTSEICMAVTVCSRKD